MPTRQIACLIFPGVMSLDVTGPMQVFASANVECERQGLPPAYELVIVAVQSAMPVSTSAGIRLCADRTLAELELAQVDTLLVPGGDGVELQAADPALLDWLRAAESQVRRLGSVCSGALILAAAGLLNDLTATTHWADVDALNAYPRINVQGDRLHTYDPRNLNGHGHIFTSAGVTAGIDLALALVEADLGGALALAVARRLVMFLKRPGGQAQFSASLAPHASRTPKLAALLEWIPLNLAADLSLQNLADRACMSPRSLSRAFMGELGISPSRHVERVRLEAARALLQGGQASVGSVARLCGYGHGENLRRIFHKHLNVSPQSYAERFALRA